MKTLLEIQNEVAKENGYDDALKLIRLGSPQIINSFVNQLCRRAQLECARETLKEASNNAAINWPQHHPGATVSKMSILDESNIKLVE